MPPGRPATEMSVSVFPVKSHLTLWLFPLIERHPYTTVPVSEIDGVNVLAARAGNGDAARFVFERPFTITRTAWNCPFAELLRASLAMNAPSAVMSDANALLVAVVFTMRSGSAILASLVPFQTQ